MTAFTIARARAAAVAFVVCILGSVCEADGQEIQIGIIDLYGLRRVSAGEVRAALTFREGDAMSLAGDERPAFLTAAENRLATLPGVARARINMVCCDQGRAIAYVGIEERGSAMMPLRARTSGNRARGG